MRQVAAAVIVEGGRLFLARRPPGDPLAGMWELPGGKLEAGETPQECLERELLEEFGMVATAADVLAQTVYEYEHGSFEILALAAVRKSAYRPVFHDGTCWVTWSGVAALMLAPADRDILAMLGPASA